MIRNYPKQTVFLFFLFLLVIQIGLHIQFLDNILSGIHLWRQSQTQNNITNFFRQDFNLLNPRQMSFNGGQDNIMRFEFPLMQWSIACLYKIFGESILITRLSMLMISVSASVGMYKIMHTLTKRKDVAMFTSWIFSFSPIFFYYSINPLPDVLALAAIIWFLHFYLLFISTSLFKHYIWASFFLLLATSSKIPYLSAGIIIATHGLQVLVQKGFLKSYFSLHFLLKASVLPLLLMPALIWYKIVIPSWGTNGVLTGIFENQISWSKFWLIFNFHWQHLLPNELLGTPNIFFFCIGIIGIFITKAYRSNFFFPLLSVLFITILYFLLEINMIDIVHDYYMMPFLPILFIICGAGIYYIVNSFLKIAVIALCCILPIFTYNQKKVSYTNYFNEIEKVLIENYQDFRSAVPKGEKCIMLNDISSHIMPYLVDKQGHIFKDDQLPIIWIEDMIKRFHIKYMYSSSRKVDESAEFQPYIDQILFTKGEVRVIKLKLPH